jgi:hypothetical protein
VLSVQVILIFSAFTKKIAENKLTRFDVAMRIGKEFGKGSRGLDINKERSLKICPKGHTPKINDKTTNYLLFQRCT